MFEKSPDKHSSLLRKDFKKGGERKEKKVYDNGKRMRVAAKNDSIVCSFTVSEKGLLFQIHLFKHKTNFFFAGK
jgi:hypothetical protein